MLNAGLFLFLGAPLAAAKAKSSQTLPGESTFTAQTEFPSSLFSEYYVKPEATKEAQPVIFDPVLQRTYPLRLTSPDTIPTVNNDALLYPEPPVQLSKEAQEALIATTVADIKSIISADNSGLDSSCSKCIAALSVAQTAAKYAPRLVPDAMVSLCQSTGFSSNSSCQQSYEAGSFGAAWTQVLAYADVVGLDGQYICSTLSTSFCAKPNVTATFNVTFPKPKPANAKAPKASGKRVKVLHLSDMHLDPRYMIGAEANCTSGLCCRPQAPLADGSSPQVAFPAPEFGAFKCDVPYSLAGALLEAIGPLSGTSKHEPPAFTIYTGDLVSHDPEPELSRDYVTYCETSVYHMLKSYLGSPVYAVLGNHDSAPANLDAPHALDNKGPLGEQFSWNYHHLAGLWQENDWISESAARQAETHYAAYSVRGPKGIRIISFNTDMYYPANYYAFINAADPDYSGMFSFLIKELQKAEDSGERVYLIGHVVPGWDGSNALPNGSDMLYQIVERYSPHVIAHMFFGHTHEDQQMIFYNNNGTQQTAENVVSDAWVGPSITPNGNLNSGFRVYEVDTGSWEVYEAYTYYADVNSFSSLDGSGPVFKFEYSTRGAYGRAAGWPASEPLNGTFWHRVTEAMEKDHSLASLFNTYQGRMSVRSPNCTNNACAEAKICYIRSGSVALGRQCPQGFASVQSSFTGTNF